MYDNSFNTITVSCSALRENYHLIQRKAGADVPVMAMVKADGYGHGMVRTSQVLTEAGCRDFGVAELREAVALREAGITGNIYVTIGFAEENAAVFFEYSLIPVVYSYSAALALSREAVARGEEIGVHIKVDSGMSRLGIFPTELAAFADAVGTLPGLSITGVMSHFPEADDPAAESTGKNFARFTEACRGISDKFRTVRHIANSGAVLNFPDTRCDMVRAGIALYGYHPAGPAETDGESSSQDLLPAMTFTSRILQIKTVPPGTGISYGHTFRTSKSTRLAVLPVGYEDGFSRLLSNKGQVLVRGQLARVLGRVCMNMCMVDVTGIADVAAGDEAVLLGRRGNLAITADDIARQTGSISYEILCLLGNNNKRLYIE